MRGAEPSVLDERACGVLLHPTSLPGPWGCGDIGPAARAFAEWLVAAGQSWWQMLPVVDPGYGASPYSARSAFAGSPLLLSPDDLVAEGFIEQADLNGLRTRSGARADLERARAIRWHAVEAAYERSTGWPKRSRERRAFEAFTEEHRDWLDDWCLFATLHHAQGDRQWTEWEPALRARKPAALAAVRRDFADDLARHAFAQWLFDRHWSRLRERCAAHGIRLLGDAPIFVAHDSADVWAHPELFHLDARGQPTVVAGVPPDYFSSTGQRWGNPLYRWSALRRDGYGWWMDRLRATLHRFDAIRLDHFVGFHNAWEIPASEPTAMNGRWVPGPGDAFFERARKVLGGLPLVAEDLGVVTPEVKGLRDRFGLPGMRVLQFAFGTDMSAPDFLPHVYPRRCLAVTGTHDNDTVVGWFTDDGRASTRTKAAIARERRACLDYLGTPGEEIHWDMIRETYRSVANLAIAPLQDVLGLGTEARMNRPGTVAGNWTWRMRPNEATQRDARRLAALARTYGRVRTARR